MTGKVFRIDIGDEFFIGRTTSKHLSQVRAAYNQQLKNGGESPLFQYVRERDMVFTPAMFSVVQEFPDCSAETLCKEHGRIQRELKPTLNFRVAGRTTKDYYEENKEQIVAQQREYQKKMGRAVIGITQKKYYLKNKEKALKYQKEYVATHKQKYAEYLKEYYRRNKEKAAEYQKQYRLKKQCIIFFLVYGILQMSSLPSQLQFALSKMSGFSKNSVKLYPLNKNGFNAGEIMSVCLPVNRVIDLHSFACIFQATPLLSVLPKHAASLIGRLEVLVNGDNISGSQNAEYNTLYNLFANIMFGYDKLLEQQVYSNAADITSVPGSAGAANQPLIIDTFLSFLGGSFNRYLDLSSLGSVEIRWTWASSAVLVPTAAAAGAQSYSVSNVEFVIDTLEWSDGWFQKSIAHALESGPIYIPYKQFASYNYSVSATSGAVNTAYGTNSLDAVYGFLRSNDYDSLTPSIFVGGSAGAELAIATNAHYFNFAADGSAFQYRVNNIVMPQYTATVQESYTALKNTLNGGGLNLAYVNLQRHSVERIQVRICAESKTPRRPISISSIIWS